MNQKARRWNSIKKQLFIGSMLLALVPATGCKKDKVKVETPPAYHVKFNSNSIEVPSTAGQEVTVLIESNSKWKITLSQPADWLDLNKTSGAGNDSLKLKVTKDNVTGQKRTVTVTASLTEGQASPGQLVVEQPVFVNNVTISWKKVLGGNGNEYAYSVVTLPDGSHVIAGSTSSNGDGDVGVTRGGIDFWVVKFDGNGTLDWQKTFGGNGNDVPTSLAATPDGGYALCGYSNSNNGDVAENKGGVDYWILKLDGTGNIRWKKTLGGSHDDFPNGITVTTQGVIVVAGYTASKQTGDVGNNQGSEDYWVVALENNNGNTIWKKTMGGNGSEKARSIIPTTDGGVIIGGDASSSNNGDVPATKGNIDFWLVRLTGDGNIVWSKTFGGTGNEALYALAAGGGNTLVATGITKSNNTGDVGQSKGNEDYWVTRVNSETGALVWQKTLGGNAADYGRSVAVHDNGIVVGGYTQSDNNGDVDNNQGGSDYFILGLNNDGTVAWKKTMGGDSDDQLYGINASKNGNCIAVGSTYTNNKGDVGANNGGGDFWIVKFSTANN